MNNNKHKTSQDKRTPDLADDREKPEDGEIPLINYSYYYIKRLAERERIQKSKLTCQIKVKITLSNLQAIAVKFSANQKVKDDQCNNKTTPLKLGQR